MSQNKGKLYIVATPIGNLDDITVRACNTLKSVDLILAEDTRHSKKLLNHLGSKVPLQAYHDHNEREKCDQVIKLLLSGSNCALISDAGTPLINDPGFHLVSKAHDAEIPVIPIPGPSACISALSVSGLNTDRFLFLGFAPSKRPERLEFFSGLNTHAETLIFYESTHRILQCLRDSVEVFGEERKACIAREMTKHYEDIKRASLKQLLEWLEGDPDKQKGEFVIIIAGKLSTPSEYNHQKSIELLQLLLDHLPTKTAADLAARYLDEKKNKMYQLALSIKKPEN